MFVKIAVCDDEIKLCSLIEEEITKVLKEKNLEFETDVFFSGETLCTEMNRTKYDIVFLDIELPGMNGVDIGKYIRENLNDNLTQIVYISSKKDYAMELFQIRPMNFLIKPINTSKLNEIIDVFIKLKGGANDIFYYKKGQAEFKEKLFNIMYFLKDGRQVRIYTTQGEDCFYGNLESVYEKVKKHGFLFIHKSYIVNTKYIKVMKYESVIMVDGKILSISQSRRGAIRDMYNEMEER